MASGAIRRQHFPLTALKPTDFEVVDMAAEAYSSIDCKRNFTAADP
jgi:hypothetical protein